MAFCSIFPEIGQNDVSSCKKITAETPVKNKKHSQERSNKNLENLLLVGTPVADIRSQEDLQNGKKIDSSIPFIPYSDNPGEQIRKTCSSPLNQEQGKRRTNHIPALTFDRYDRKSCPEARLCGNESSKTPRDRPEGCSRTSRRLIRYIPASHFVTP
jgi:hypothetical protein